MRGNETLDGLRSILERKKGHRDQLKSNIEKTKQEIKNLKRDILRHDKAYTIIKQVGLNTQKQLEFHLSEQVSLAMEAVFPDPYMLKVDFQEKRGKTEANFLFVRDELELDPIGNVGGGTIDIASLALRIAYWAIRQDKKVRPLLLLDEPFSRLKGEETNRQALAMIQAISKKLGLQIIMISDERVSREQIIDNADKVFQVFQGKNKKSSIETLKKE